MTETRHHKGLVRNQQIEPNAHWTVKTGSAEIGAAGLDKGIGLLALTITGAVVGSPRLHHGASGRSS